MGRVRTNAAFLVTTSPREGTLDLLSRDHCEATLVALTLFLLACGADEPAHVPSNANHDDAPASTPIVAPFTVVDGGSGARSPMAVFSECSNDYDDVRAASEATIRIVEDGAALEPSLVEAAWSCFARFRPSRSNSPHVIPKLADLVRAVKAPSYGPKAVALLAVPAPADFRDTNAHFDEMNFRQFTAVRIIGDLHYTPGVRPLVNALLTPGKEALEPVIETQLLTMPREAEPTLIAVLNGTDVDLATFLAKNPDPLASEKIARALALLSRRAGLRAVLDALARETNEKRRAMFAAMLARFPTSPATVKAFEDTYAKLPRAPAALEPDLRVIMLPFAEGFSDAAVATWIVRAVKSVDNDLAILGLHAAIMLMDASNVKEVGIALSKLDGDGEKDLFAAVEPLVVKCKRDVTCFLHAFDTPAVTSHERAVQVKAAGMAAMLGDATTKQALLSKIGAVNDRHVRAMMADAVFRLSPVGDEAAADAIDAVTTDREHTGFTVHEVAMRLRARVL